MLFNNQHQTFAQIVYYGLLVFHCLIFPELKKVQKFQILLGHATGSQKYLMLLFCPTCANILECEEVVCPASLLLLAFVNYFLRQDCKLFSLQLL